ncbi:MAG: hypothetical protein Q8P81_02320 [Nanoarchaeota archaeon]|nr:hypothetical protein [Nanoarchaeota archaeon]
MTTGLELSGINELEVAVGQALGSCIQGSTDDARRATLNVLRRYNSPEFSKFRDSYGRLFAYAKSDSYRENFIKMSLCRDAVAEQAREDTIDPLTLMQDLGGLKTYLSVVKLDLELMEEEFRLAR